MTHLIRVYLELLFVNDPEFLSSKCSKYIGLEDSHVDWTSDKSKQDYWSRSTDKVHSGGTMKSGFILGQQHVDQIIDLEISKCSVVSQGFLG